MSCNLAETTIVVATRNTGKVREIAELLIDLPYRFINLLDMPEIPEVVEDGDTFEANAVKKAVETARAAGMWALADDSGLEVDALGGRPGVYSARFSGENATDESNRQLLLELLKDIPLDRRSARFVCVIAIASPKGDVRTVRGNCEGRISFAPRGSSGFGYDPLFEVPEFSWMTFAEIEEFQKNSISHRGRALQAAKEILKDLPAI